MAELGLLLLCTWFLSLLGMQART
ncbi:unnamed protein product [Linum tenue]|uniref:Uncharacterized protein n=1 Tax=Linum tenue TaxID=586396 RepID=A0AAV0LIN2_9ROSI|nr:unnamed protein product [Linum tenue]